MRQTVRQLGMDTAMAAIIMVVSLSFVAFGVLEGQAAINYMWGAVTMALCFEVRCAINVVRLVCYLVSSK